MDANNHWEKIVKLKSPDETVLMQGLKFSADGSQLAVVTDAHLIYIWNLPAIREQLAKMDLDWPLPAYPALPPERAVSAPARRSALKPLSTSTWSSVNPRSAGETAPGTASSSTIWRSVSTRSAPGSTCGGMYTPPEMTSCIALSMTSRVADFGMNPSAPASSALTMVS